MAQLCTSSEWEATRLETMLASRNKRSPKTASHLEAMQTVQKAQSKADLRLTQSHQCLPAAKAGEAEGRKASAESGDRSGKRKRVLRAASDLAPGSCPDADSLQSCGQLDGSHSGFATTSPQEGEKDKQNPCTVVDGKELMHGLDMPTIEGRVIQSQEGHAQRTSVDEVTLTLPDAPSAMGVNSNGNGVDRSGKRKRVLRAASDLAPGSCPEADSLQSCGQLDGSHSGFAAASRQEGEKDKQNPCTAVDGKEPMHGLDMPTIEGRVIQSQEGHAQRTSVDEVTLTLPDAPSAVGVNSNGNGVDRSGKRKRILRAASDLAPGSCPDADSLQSCGQLDGSHSGFAAASPQEGEKDKKNPCTAVDGKEPMHGLDMPTIEGRVIQSQEGHAQRTSVDEVTLTLPDAPSAMGVNSNGNGVDRSGKRKRVLRAASDLAPGSCPDADSLQSCGQLDGSHSGFATTSPQEGGQDKQISGTAGDCKEVSISAQPIPCVEEHMVKGDGQDRPGSMDQVGCVTLVRQPSAAATELEASQSQSDLGVVRARRLVGKQRPSPYRLGSNVARAQIGHMLQPPELGFLVRVQGDGWGGKAAWGSCLAHFPDAPGSLPFSDFNLDLVWHLFAGYLATVTEADAETFTVIRRGDCYGSWDETHVLKTCCTLLARTTSKQQLFLSAAKQAV